MLSERRELRQRQRRLNESVSEAPAQYGSPHPVPESISNLDWLRTKSCPAPTHFFARSATRFVGLVYAAAPAAGFLTRATACRGQSANRSIQHQRRRNICLPGCIGIDYGRNQPEIGIHDVPLTEINQWMNNPRNREPHHKSSRIDRIYKKMKHLGSLQSGPS